MRDNLRSPGEQRILDSVRPSKGNDVEFYAFVPAIMRKGGFELVFCSRFDGRMETFATCVFFGTFKSAGEECARRNAVISTSLGLHEKWMATI